MKKAILVSLVLVLLILAGCKEKQEPKTVYVEPDQTVQENKTTKVVVDESNGTTTDDQPSEVDVGDGSESDDLDLSEYPSPFIKDGKLNAYVIVGAKATSLEVVAATELLAGVEFTGRMGSYYPDALDTDFDSIANKNAILLGNPCNNRFIEALMPYSSDCLEDFSPGEAIIKLYKTGSDSYALVVGGYSGADTRKAAQYMGDYASKSLSGTEISV
ncbi:hypothetical protein KY331_02515 [Candidatus Woesearchaeota archaeon]|nr:hypothetical protein [Candidatus Woesearchaeota archaeon]